MNGLPEVLGVPAPVPWRMGPHCKSEADNHMHGISLLPEESNYQTIPTNVNQWPRVLFILSSLSPLLTAVYTLPLQEVSSPSQIGCDVSGGGYSPS